jgi:uncharacterized RDD family membrane protein YckC
MTLLSKEYPQFEESIYAGFWLRLGANLLDFIFIMIFGICVYFLQLVSEPMFYLGITLQLALMFFYGVYFIKQYGATPGKYIAGIKIVKLDGTDAGWNEAVQRYFVDFCIAMFGLVVNYMAVQSIGYTDFQEMGFAERGMAVQAFNPALLQVQQYLAMGWFLSELIVLLTNKRRRALHDFIGETLVIKAKYQQQVLEIEGQKSEEA